MPKKAIVSKQDCCSTNILIVIYHETEINCDLYLETQYFCTPTGDRQGSFTSTYVKLYHLF